MKHLKYFPNAAAIGSGIEVDLPNVSYLEGKNVEYSSGNSGKATIRIDESGNIYRDYASEYFTFEAIESGTFKLVCVEDFDPLTGEPIPVTTTIDYSLDNGSTWVTLSANTNTPTIAAGSKIMWKGALEIGMGGVGNFSATGNFNVYGNIMSLLYGDEFIGVTSLSNKNYIFNQLFYNNTKLNNAKNLILPATTLAYACYSDMFYGCTNLTTAPELPATTLVNSCYFQMFYNCRSLNYIKAMFTTTPSATYTGDWVSGVSSTGTFVKNSAATWNVTGVNGIPSGWTVQTASS